MEPPHNQSSSSTSRSQHPDPNVRALSDAVCAVEERRKTDPAFDQGLRAHAAATTGCSCNQRLPNGDPLVCMVHPK